ncbi:MAG TPA: succinate dehydrogenase, cytochrome b556 subunit [Rhodanobacteraceae bacterium]|jgi:succinate dehydrogenase / fumarate reductase cytochrome b subunit|nr:succinate dehydrogenase, cytochrome b556 subunit [Rhodanobacteraceae bacterium]
MPANARPLSPHLSIYRWQIQMVTSILHRATGIFLALGTILVCAALIALASGADAFAKVAAFSASWIGTVLLLGWTWSLAFHLLNGIRHLAQDLGFGYAVPTFVRNGWIVTIGSFVLTALVWACVLAQRGAA